ncbi:MAG: energy transducer TonB [Bdellovibrio sp.]|nr:energy transducer TonB [Bdellovibrio sp.]
MRSYTASSVFLSLVTHALVGFALISIPICFDMPILPNYIEVFLNTEFSNLHIKDHLAHSQKSAVSKNKKLVFSTEESAQKSIPKPLVAQPEYFMPHPQYPKFASKKGWQGEVLLELTANHKGEVLDISIMKSSGFAVLDQVAVDTLKNWRVSPLARLQVPIRFQLKDEL